jgi:hypothetical protein
LKLGGGMHVDVVSSTLKLGNAKGRLSYLSMWAIETKRDASKI